MGAGRTRSVVTVGTREVVSTLDLYDYLLRGDTKNDVVLEQGDVVFVPVRGVRRVAPRRGHPVAASGNSAGTLVRLPLR